MSAVVAFPGKMKRGAKVKRGPLAKMKDFPGVLRGDALAKRWLWLGENYREWDNEEFERDAEDT